MGQSSLYKTQELRSFFNFGIGAADKVSVQHTHLICHNFMKHIFCISSDQGDNSLSEAVTVEFNQEQLYQLYQQMEKVQEQLDNLT